MVQWKKSGDKWVLTQPVPIPQGNQSEKVPDPLKRLFSSFMSCLLEKYEAFLTHIVPVHWSGLWEMVQFLQAEHSVLGDLLSVFQHEHILELKRWWRMNWLALDRPFSGKSSKSQGTRYVLSGTFHSPLSPIQRFAMLVALINLIELQFVSAWLSQQCQKCLVP